MILNRKPFVSVLALGLLILAGTLSAKPWEERGSRAPELVRLPSLRPIIEQVDSSVVNISTSVEAAAMDPGTEGPFGPFMSPEQLFERFFRGPGQRIPRRSMGTGFLFSKKGHILTNNHVIEGADRVEVTVTTFHGSQRQPQQENFVAQIIGRDPRTDVAILKIESERDFPFAYLGDSDSLKKGDWVMAFGNPFGLDHSVSVGIVSAKGREISPNENRRFDDFIQTDAIINFGNSGGPLVNTRAEVIGMNTAIISPAQGSGIGFAIPINVVKEIIPQLLERGAVARGYLGVMIQDITEAMKEGLGLQSRNGVVVNDIVEDGPSARSALKPGDIIVRVDQTRIEDSRSLQRVIGRSKPNQEVQVEVIRDGKRMTLSVQLGALDEDGSPSLPMEDGPSFDRLGLLLEEPKEAGRGLRVVAIRPDHQSGVFPDDEIRRIIRGGKSLNLTNLETYQNLIKELEDGENIVFHIVRSGGAQFYLDFEVPSSRGKSP
ncbi:MAG: PDZ domain-containing protein [Bradymonadales bacterium]|nr:MAG: PDZ domain-containing protein [Bradymonadales bacterium]